MTSPTLASLSYKPFAHPLWISHMYLLIYVYFVFYHLHGTQSLFESDHKNDWSHANCQTQTQVLIINVIYCCFKSQTNPSLPSLVPSMVIWSQFAIIVKKKKKKDLQRKCCQSWLLFCIPPTHLFLSLQWLTFNLINIAWAHWLEQREREKKQKHLFEHLSDLPC